MTEKPHDLPASHDGGAKPILEWAVAWLILAGGAASLVFALKSLIG